MDNNILHEHTKQAYIEAVNRNWNSLMTKFRNYPHYEFQDSPELSTMACQVKIPMFNRVTNTSLTTEKINQLVLNCSGVA